MKLRLSIDHPMTHTVDPRDFLDCGSDEELMEVLNDDATVWVMNNLSVTLSESEINEFITAVRAIEKAR